MARTIKRKRDLHEKLSRRNFIATVSAAAVLSGQIGDSKAQNPGRSTDGIERALSAYFSSLPQGSRYPQLVEKLAFGEAEYDLGWWAPIGRTAKYRRSILLRAVDGVADLHIVMPASHPTSGQPTPLPPPGQHGIFSGPPQSRLPKGIALAWRRMAGANQVSDHDYSIGPLSFNSITPMTFMLQDIALVYLGERLRINPQNLYAFLIRTLELSERDSAPVSGVLEGPKTGSGIEVQANIRRGHFLVDVFRDS